MSDLNKEPLISVVIPMYNEEASIRDTLASIINQNYNNIQLILVDDGSDDNCVSLTEDYVKDIPGEHTILQNTTNLGQSFARNRGAMYADGKYIIFHDADDLSTPERLRKQVEFLENHPEVGVLGGAYYYLNPYRNQTELKRRPTNDEEIREKMARECMINLGTAMFRREALFETDLFRSRNVEGYELVIDVGKKWELANLDDPVYLYRINDSSRSQKNEIYKKALIGYRSYQAIRAFDLSYWYLLLQFGWMIYMNAPTPVQRAIRRIFSPTEERDLTEQEQKEIKKLIKKYEH